MSSSCYHLSWLALSHSPDRSLLAIDKDNGGAILCPAIAFARTDIKFTTEGSILTALPNGFVLLQPGGKELAVTFQQPVTLCDMRWIFLKLGRLGYRR